MLFALLAVTACELEPWGWGGYSYTAVDAVHADDDRTAYVLDRYIRGADCTPVPLLCWREGGQRMLLEEWVERPLIVGEDLVIAVSSGIRSMGSIYLSSSRVNWFAPFPCLRVLYSSITTLQKGTENTASYFSYWNSLSGGPRPASFTGWTPWNPN
jgi:hypothetical protein